MKILILGILFLLPGLMFAHGGEHEATGQWSLIHTVEASVIVIGLIASLFFAWKNWKDKQKDVTQI